MPSGNTTAAVLQKASGNESKFLHLHFPGTGWNNQRQNLVLGVLLARLLNRSLIAPKHIASNKHFERTRTHTDELVDTAYLNTLVPVSLRDGLRAHPGMFLNTAQCCDLSGEDVAQLRAAAAVYPTVHLQPMWGPSIPFFAGALESQVEVVAAFSTRREFALCADEIIRHFGVVDALHLRAGDKDPMPLLDCEACGMRTNKSTGFPFPTCTRAGLAMQFSDAIDCALAQGVVLPGNPLYVATNLNAVQVSRALNTTFAQRGAFEKMSHILSYLAEKGTPVLTWNDVISSGTTPASCSGIDLTSGYMVSIVEQYICAHAPGYYFAQFPSSWDELVLWVRHVRGKSAGVEAGRWVEQLLLYWRWTRTTNRMYRDSVDGSTSHAVKLTDAHGKAQFTLPCRRCLGK